MNVTMEISTGRRIAALSMAGLAMLALAGAPEAHHSGIMYDPTPLWFTGTVVRFEDINPHTIITVEERGAGGQVDRWAVEGPARFQLDASGKRADVPSVGDVVGFCAFPYKSAAELSRLFPEAKFSGPRFTDGTSPQYVWGHVMVTPEGEKRLWNPHGVLGECIRSSNEPRQAWVDFLDSDLRVRQAWCEQRAYAHVRSTPALQKLVEAVNGQIDAPCP